MNEPNAPKHANASSHRRPHWLRLGICLLLLVITIVAGTLALTMKRLHDRKAAIANIHEAGGTMGVSIAGPEWLRKLIGDDECFYEPQRVSLGPLAKGNPHLDDAILASLSESLKGWRDLQVLDIRGSAVTDKSAPLCAQLASVTHLRLSDTQITDTTIRHIKQLPNLQSLLLANTHLTDNCVSDLSEIATLTSLDIRGTQISLDSVTQLKESLPTCNISN
jgi:hypothetical protein